MEYHCELCDISGKIKSKKRHLNSQPHKHLDKQVINRYHVENPDFIQIENILKNYVHDYNKKFDFCAVICKWKVHFSNKIIYVKTNPWHNHSCGFNLREFLLSRIKYYERRQHIFCRISLMTITFISDLRDMTYKHYLQQPKSMLEWRLNLILAKRPELIEVFDIGKGIASHFRPLIRKYSNFFNDGGGN